MPRSLQLARVHRCRSTHGLRQLPGPRLDQRYRVAVPSFRPNRWESLDVAVLPEVSFVLLLVSNSVRQGYDERSPPGPQRTSAAYRTHAAATGIALHADERMLHIRQSTRKLNRLRNAGRDRLH